MCNRDKNRVFVGSMAMVFLGVTLMGACVDGDGTKRCEGATDGATTVDATAQETSGGDSNPGYEYDPNLPPIVKIIEPKLPRIVYTDSDTASFKIAIWYYNLANDNIWLSVKWSPSNWGPGQPENGSRYVDLMREKPEKTGIVEYVIDGVGLGRVSIVAGPQSVSSRYSFNSGQAGRAYQDHAWVLVQRQGCIEDIECNDHNSCTVEWCWGECYYLPRLTSPNCSGDSPRSYEFDAMYHYNNISACGTDNHCESKIPESSINSVLDSSGCEAFGCFNDYQTCGFGASVANDGGPCRTPDQNVGICNWGDCVTPP